MAQIQEFFALEDTQKRLQNLHRILARVPESDIKRYSMAQQLILVNGILLNNAVQFDEHCQQNIKWIGTSFRSQLPNLDVSEEPLKLDQLLSTFYRFIVEFDLSIKNDLSIELRSFQRFVQENVEKFESRGESRRKSYMPVRKCRSQYSKRC